MSEKLTHIWNGIYTYGYIDKYVGFSFDFRDNLERVKQLISIRIFTPITGVDARTDNNIVNLFSKQNGV
jgi:hypothetical protein